MKKLALIILIGLFSCNDDDPADYCLCDKRTYEWRLVTDPVTGLPGFKQVLIERIQVCGGDTNGQYVNNPDGSQYIIECN